MELTVSQFVLFRGTQAPSTQVVTTILMMLDMMCRKFWLLVRSFKKFLRKRELLLSQISLRWISHRLKDTKMDPLAARPNQTAIFTSFGLSMMDRTSNRLKPAKTMMKVMMEGTKMLLLFLAMH